MKPHWNYSAYLAIGVCYVLVKAVFILCGFLHLGALLYGAIPAVLTLIVGALAFGERARVSRNVPVHWAAILIPCLIFGVTPVYMHLKAGEQWLANGCLPVLVIYSGLAIAQLVLAVRAVMARARTVCNGDRTP